MNAVPDTQFAVQLVGPDELVLNERKAVYHAGPHQMLCEVEAVGLCFSDLKLLKQFTDHVRKGPITEGIDPQVLEEFPSYAPDEKPTVPGHEAVVRVCELGPGMDRYHLGQRFLVQTDYRWIRTASGSNAAFGYNIEGGLQQYVLMDQRVFTSPEGESLMIPVDEAAAASAIALVEPWACVEDAYVSSERRTLKAGGRLLVVADVEPASDPVPALVQLGGEPGSVVRATDAELEELPDASFDDVVYLGSDGDVIERLCGLLAPMGLLNIALCGNTIGRKLNMPVGRVHYGGIRITGTAGDDPLKGMRHVPATGELRPGEVVHVVGAAGPMGTMHVVRDLCQGVPGVHVVASDLDPQRLDELRRKAEPLARAHGVTLSTVTPDQIDGSRDYSYVALMAPVPALVAAAVDSGGENAIINIFAGIPAEVSAKLDMDRYVRRGMYMIGTSGSVIRDMRIVLDKIAAGRLDTNTSVAAVSGMRGAIAGLRAVEDRTTAGKIVVYPSLPDLGLVPLDDLPSRFPTVAAHLADGNWTPEAERELLAVAGGGRHGEMNHEEHEGHEGG